MRNSHQRFVLTVLLSFLALGLWPQPAAAATCVPLAPCPPVPPSEDPPSEPGPEPEPAPESAPPESASPAPGTVDQQAASRLLALINDERRKAGVPPLSPRADVEEIAVSHSKQMAAAGRIWHNDDYFTPGTRADLGARSLGENVAFNGSVDDAHQRLMASPGHRKNILSAAFRVVGIGVVRGSSSWFVTQDFVEPRAAAPAAPAPPGATPKPTSVAAARPVRVAVAFAAVAPAHLDEAPAATSTSSTLEPGPDRPVFRFGQPSATAGSATQAASGGPEAPLLAAGALVAAAALLARSREAWR